MKKRFTALLLCFVLLLASCGGNTSDSEDFGKMTEGFADGEKSFGEDIEAMGVYSGYFEGRSDDITVTCIFGTEGAYTLKGETLTFTEVSADTAYSVSGKFRGNIVIDTGDDHKFDLELHGLSLVCDQKNPITVESGKEVGIKAKKDTKNFIYDMREAIDPNNTLLEAGAIFSKADLEIGGKGELVLISENNNGIHTKKDLQVQNLKLFVACIDNALKGNDSVEMLDCNTTLIASCGDGIKTSRNDISSKNKQRGTVSIAGGTHNIYAASDGIDSAYNVILDKSVTADSTPTAVNIYTDKYSAYSKEISAVSGSDKYIRYAKDGYFYSVKYSGSAGELWVNADRSVSVQDGDTEYHYYSYPVKEGYEKQQIFVYEKESQMGKEKCLYSSEVFAVNTASDTLALTNSFTDFDCEWTSFGIKVNEDGFGGIKVSDSGDTPKGEFSSKGIKAANEIRIGTAAVNIKSYDDGIHADNDSLLENGLKGIGNVSISGGTVNVYTKDKGIRADGTFSISEGTLNIINSYEGIEGMNVDLAGGEISVLAENEKIGVIFGSDSEVKYGEAVIKAE